MPLAINPGGFSFGDPYYLALAAAGVALFIAVGALSHAHERPFSAALTYLAIGVVADLVIRVTDIGRGIDPLGDHSVMERVTGLAMIVALFATGLRVRRSFRDPGWGLAGRLLGGTMPLTIAGVAVWGAAVMDLPWGAAIVLGAALAPTDPVLAGGLGVRPPGEEEEEPEHDREFAISAEAGLNDGLALPFLVLGLLVYEHDGTNGGWVGDWILINVVYASLVPLVLGYLAGRTLARLATALRHRDLLAPRLDPWIGLAAAPLVYGGAELISTYGFLAVVAAGFGFRQHEVDHEAHRGVHTGVEQVQHFAELTVILLVGVMLTREGLEAPGASGWLLIPVLLLLVRPLAVLAGLVRSGLGHRDRAFLAWFGVKGVASLNYLFVALGTGLLASTHATTVAWTVILAVAVSIVVHGITATPATRRLE